MKHQALFSLKKKKKNNKLKMSSAAVVVSALRVSLYRPIYVMFNPNQCQNKNIVRVKTVFISFRI